MSTSAVLNINPSSCKAPSQFPVVFLSIYFAREGCVKSLVSWFKIGTDFIAIAYCALTSTCVHTQKHTKSPIYIPHHRATLSRSASTAPKLRHPFATCGSPSYFRPSPQTNTRPVSPRSAINAQTIRLMRRAARKSCFGADRQV